MKSYFVTYITETLSKKPEYGIISSMLPLTMTTADMLQMVGVILGLFIAVITAILKVIELKDVIKERASKYKKRTTKKDTKED
jgi:MFS superfamily sulfate permease-like transporter